MRIVAGRHKGRVLTAPPGKIARPTAARTREALFNILNHGGRVTGASVLDAFAGTGALGFEALSQGAAYACFLDNAGPSLVAIAANAAMLGETERAGILRADATRPGPAPRAFDLVFLDPPYRSGLGASALAALAERGWLAAGALAVTEVAAREDFVPPPGFSLADDRTYGAARLLFFERERSDT
jgi:16S rRNA (guanine966-N2)-methyltransferase